jgi:phage terminase large subunit-like protein
VLTKNETLHVIERPGTEQRIRAKTAWNADTLRGDYADLLIFDEWQLMDEDAWETVGLPMLLDNNGDAVFIYTPPSLRSRSTSKARDPRHAGKMFAFAMTSERWATFHFRSSDNPHISGEALKEIASDMTNLAYRQEILAEDIDEVPGAMWTRALIESVRVRQAPELRRVVIGIDPSATSGQGSDEAGIVAVGLGIDNHAYVLTDASLRASPDRWAREGIVLYHRLKADRIVAETNNGGEMVALTLRTVDPSVSYRAVQASHGKQTRAEPIVALYEQGKVHHVGNFAALEDEMCSWAPGDQSPNRMDALVWALTELMLQQRMPWRPVV